MDLRYYLDFDSTIKIFPGSFLVCYIFDVLSSMCVFYFKEINNVEFVV